MTQPFATEPIWSTNNTAAAFVDPQPGDHFSEMMAFHVFVVDRNGDHVVWCYGNAPITFPDGGTFAQGTCDEFRDGFRYATNEGYWVRLHQRGVNVAGWLPADLISDDDGELAPFGYLPDSYQPAPPADDSTEGTDNA